MIDVKFCLPLRGLFSGYRWHIIARLKNALTGAILCLRSYARIYSLSAVQWILNQLMFGKLIEEKIREAMEAGDFDNLPGKGKPINLDDYFATPEDVRLGYSVLKSSRCLPEEVELRREIEELKAEMEPCTDESRRQALQSQIVSRTLKLNLLADSNRRQRRQKA